MATPVNDEFISFLMVGKTGEGKSSTGNSILGRQVFQATPGVRSVTNKCQSEVAKVQGHNVVVVDSPGLADTDIETADRLERLADDITNILATRPDGFDAVLIIVRFGKRLTREDKMVFEQLEAFFGKDYAKNYGILVVTCADSYRPAENGNITIGEFLKKEKGLFAEIREKCNNRLVWFDNKTKTATVRRAQAKRLLDMVAALRKSSDRYTPRIFQEAQESRDEAFVKAKKPFIKQNTEDSLTIILQELDDIPANSKDVKKLKDIKDKLQKHRKELQDQDKGSKVLKDVISSVSNLEKAVTARITAITENSDLANTSNKLSEEKIAMSEQLETSGRSRFAAVMGSIKNVLMRNILSIGAKVIASLFD